MSGPAAFTLPTPRDYLLHRDACSYGYFLLEPTRWSVPDRALRRTLTLDDDHAVTVIITQPPARPRARPARGTPLLVEADAALTTHDRARAAAMLVRMLRLDEPAAALRHFHRLDPRWKPSGRGRLFRSPTLFEDVAKTVTSCNVTWPGTVQMNRRLCEVLGPRSAAGFHGFPSPARLARTRPATLRARCRVGYRDQRLVDLARLFAAADAPALEDPSLDDESLRARLLELPGVGPYAAANILQLLGRYAHLPLDTESVRHGRAVLGFRGSARAIMRRVQRHFAPFGEHRFRSYWFELWADYERQRGPAWTWDREQTGATFTAAKLERA